MVRQKQTKYHCKHSCRHTDIYLCRGSYPNTDRSARVCWNEQKCFKVTWEMAFPAVKSSGQAVATGNWIQGTQSMVLKVNRAVLLGFCGTCSLRPHYFKRWSSCCLRGVLHIVPGKCLHLLLIFIENIEGFSLIYLWAIIYLMQNIVFHHFISPSLCVSSLLYFTVFYSLCTYCNTHLILSLLKMPKLVFSVSAHLEGPNSAFAHTYVAV